mgnify:CR=1 FL=1
MKILQYTDSGLVLCSCALVAMLLGSCAASLGHVHDLICVQWFL